MTSLAGEFQTDLSRGDALNACVAALDSLGYRIETVGLERVIGYPQWTSGPNPKVEVELHGPSSGGTDYKIIGSDSEAAPLSQDALITELNRVRDSIRQSVEHEASSPEWVPDAEGDAEESDESPLRDDELADLERAWGYGPSRGQRVFQVVYVLLVVAVSVAGGIWAATHDPLGDVGRVVVGGNIALLIWAVVARHTAIGQIIGNSVGWLLTVPTVVWLVRVIAG